MENVEGMWDQLFCNHHGKAGLGKNHQWMLNLGGIFDKEGNICMTFPHCLLVASEKKTAIIIQ